MGLAEFLSLPRSHGGLIVVVTTKTRHDATLMASFAREGKKSMTPFEIDWWPKRVVSGADSIERLPELMASLGRSRALIICGKSVFAGPVYKKIRDLLGNYARRQFSR